MDSINLKNGWLVKVASWVLSRLISKKIKSEIKITINELTLITDGPVAKIHLDADGLIDKEDVDKIVKKLM